MEIYQKLTFRKLKWRTECGLFKTGVKMSFTIFIGKLQASECVTAFTKTTKFSKMVHHLMAYCSVFAQNFSNHCLTRFYMFSDQFWLIWGNSKFTKFSTFWEKEARKVFRGLKTIFWGSVSYRPQYENISPTSQKLKSVEKKKLTILVHDLEFFQEIVRKIFWVWPYIEHL